MNNNVNYAFFGTGALAESVLASLCAAGYIPSLIVTKPDAPQGRHMVMTSPHIKTWADMKNIPVIQPTSLKDLDKNSLLHTAAFDLFIVASYGKIIPDDIIALPKMGALNVHPSLLPLYRGPSPIESALYDGKSTTGVTIIKLDSQMDHGPMLVQVPYTIPPHATAGTLEVVCGQIGGDLLTQCIEPYLSGNLIPVEQNHAQVTICKKITKDMGEILITTDAITVQRKFRALTPWPSVYFFIEHNERKLRVKINSIILDDIFNESDTADKVILSVTPEGKTEMSWESFKNGYKLTTS